VKQVNIREVGSNIRVSESSERNEDQHTSPPIWIVQDATIRDYQINVYLIHWYTQQF